MTSDLSISEALNHEVDLIIRCSSTVGQQYVRMLDSVGRGGEWHLTRCHPPDET